MKAAVVLLALSLVCLSAWAVEIDAPSTVYLYDAPKGVDVKIVNAKETAQQFSVQFDAPTQFELSEESGSVEAQRSKTISITLYPRSDLVGQTYESKLVVALGKEKFAKKLRMVFRGGRGQLEEQAGGNESATPAGLFGLASAWPALTAFEVTTELVLDAFLAVIAAVLLIAFIARFVKRMEGR
jgi:hypothetical protein